MVDRNLIGRNAEQLAYDFLKKKGFKLLQQNYRCYQGEIDLIMQDKEETVFIEVRSKNRADFCSAVESITDAKQRKIIRTATHYLQKQNTLDTTPCRFDVIGIDGNNVEWIKDAFNYDG